MIRLSQVLSLIFFACILTEGCRHKDREEISIVWKNEEAAAISIPKQVLKSGSKDTDMEFLQVRLEKNSTAMLGEYEKKGDQIFFRPVVPLSPGMSYEVVYHNQVISTLKIPVAGSSKAPEVVGVYPTPDTLPENLLKLYFTFSSPMREGEALQHIFLLDEENDTLTNVFLDLQPELWNKERTILTIWLDPGRIKRDLVPNRQMGNPLQKSSVYTLVLSEDWKNVKGLPLQQSFNKKFIVGARDNRSPEPENWKIFTPYPESTNAVIVNFGEPLDYFLLLETVRIADSKGNIVDGGIRVIKNETGLEFLPDKPWAGGRYSIQVATHLEDLAGNNLNRVFDRDVLLQPTKSGVGIVEKQFEIIGLSRN